MTGLFWTDERVEILKARAGRWRARAIAELLGCTRNAVIGKAYRLGLPGSAHRGGRTVTTGAGLAKRAGGFKRRVSRPRRLAPIELPVAAGEPPSLRVALIDLREGACRWIPGDDCRCCGHATARISPYCSFHSARATRTVRRRGLQFA